jgi:hypothetical protein
MLFAAHALQLPADALHLAGYCTPARPAARSLVLGVVIHDREKSVYDSRVITSSPAGDDQPARVWFGKPTTSQVPLLCRVVVVGARENPCTQGECVVQAGAPRVRNVICSHSG